MNLSRKTAVITGASSGIGRATAIEMARRGANVVLAARRAGRLEETAAACRAHGVTVSTIATDVTSREECRRLMDQAGTVDILVNNAGFALFAEATAAVPADLEEMMKTNYFGAVHCTQAVLPQMLARRSGTIVNVGSITGIMGFARMSGYCASKFALAGYTEALRTELRPQGVRVSLICPGTTETEFFVKAERGKMPGASRLMLAIKPERVARVICDAAEDGRYRTILPVLAALYMRFKEIFPRTAHWMFRGTSLFLERK